MSSRGTHGSRPTKGAEKEREKSRIPILGLSRKSSVTSTTSTTPKISSSSSSWFSRGKKKQTTTPPPAPTTSMSSITTKRPVKSSDVTAVPEETLGQTRQPMPSGSAPKAPAAKLTSSTLVPDLEKKQRNVLRRKPSSIDQRSRYAHTESSVSSVRHTTQNPQDAVSSPHLSAEQQDASVFGVVLPVTSASSSYLSTRRAEPSDQATSSSRMAAYNAHRMPKTPTPQLLQPLAPSFANSSGSSTRRSESPGSFSRTSTPTSISSYSPGIPLTTKSSLRPRQTSPTRSRPPVTRHWPGNGSKQQLEAIESRSLSSVQETATSSSSSDTVRGNERPAPPQPGAVPVPIVQDTLRRVHSPLIRHADATETAEHFSEDLEAPQEGPSYLHQPAHGSYTHLARSVAQLSSRTPPPRPSREGTPRLEDVVFPSPIIKSNLSHLETTGHKRRESWGKIAPSPAYDVPRPSKSQSIQATSATKSIPESAKPSRLPSPNSVYTGSSQTWPVVANRAKVGTETSSRDHAARRGRDLSPVNARAAKQSSRFGLFSRRASPVRKSTTESVEKANKKGPAAGTGHEGYGKYARRGRSGSTGTSSSRGRSTSSNGTSSSVPRASGSRKNSFTGKEEPEMDDFLRDRLSPVIISGGRVSSDPSDGAELYRTTSGASSASIISSDDSSLQYVGRQPTTMVVNSTASSRRTSTSLPRGRERLKSATTSDSEDPGARGHTLAARRSMHRSQLLDRGEPITVPAPINTRSIAPSPAMGSRDTLLSSAPRTGGSLQLADDISEGREGNWLKSKKVEKSVRPSKWNFLQRANGAHKKASGHRPGQDQEWPEEVPVSITNLPVARPVAHYAIIDDSSHDADGFDNRVPSLTDIELSAVAGQSPSLSHRHEAWRRQERKRSMLLPSPPIMTGEFSSDQGPPSPKVLLRQPAPVTQAPAEVPKPKTSRLQQIGRIPSVVSKRDRQHKPPPHSFSRPFARESAMDQTHPLSTASQEPAYNLGRPALGVQTDTIPSDPWGEQMSAKPASAPARPGAPPHGAFGDEFLVFPQRHSSGLSGSSSSGTMSFVVAPAGDRTMAPSHEDDVWNEYDDFLDTVESPVPVPAHLVKNASKRNSPPKHRMAPAPLQIRKNSSASSTHSTSGQELPPVANAPTLPLPSPPSMMNLLSPDMASSPMSFSAFIAGYGDRNRGSAVRSSVSGSRYSQASVPSTPSEAEQKRHTHIMAEKTRNSSSSAQDSSGNFRFNALMTSRWLSFNRVLFSPADLELSCPPGTTQNRILVLDGLGNDDWSFYAALTYPHATVYNLASFRRMSRRGTTNNNHNNKPTLPNHRQIFHAGNPTAPFPFPKSYFAAAVLRFPAAATETAHANAIAECKRVLRPGAHLELCLLDLDLVNMGDRARRAVRGLKLRLRAKKSPDVDLKPLSDNMLKMLGRRGFEGLMRCVVTVPVVAPRQQVAEEKGGITDMVSKVGRWWYERCYECNSDEEQNVGDGSIWDDTQLLRECETRETGLKLLVAYAQKPARPKRRTISL
ncbi:MAG: hypothetical protein LQ341_004520 [Variospora aurantia]|nr:MAG: hypothetical protein LQ341_004520 [Variospora aurantia]